MTDTNRPAARPSTGALISTLCFAGAALALADAALGADGLRAIGLWACGAAAAAGALRFQIARALAWIRTRA